jgi:hypothetical protein
MIEASTRFVAFGGVRIRLDLRGRRAREIGEFLYRDMDDCEEDALQATFQVEDDPASDSVTVRRDEIVCHRGNSLANVARALQEATSYALAAGSVSGLLFHAAAVSRNERVLLFPGKSGAGKTTVTARLVAQGFRYLTDELVFVPDGARSVRALPRPLNVKSSGRAAAARDIDSGAGWRTLVSPVAMLLQPPASQTGSSSDIAALSAVVFPRFRRAEAARLTPLSPAECGLRLMACLINARNLPAHGFPDVSEIARRTPSYDLVYSDVDQVRPQMAELV